MEQNQAVGTIQKDNLPWLGGAIGGFVATLPMTIFILLMHRLLPKWQKYKLPPQQITDELTGRAGLKKHMDNRQRVGAALAAHFGYGATMGVLYSLLTRFIPLPSLLKGSLFGLLVWTGSYLGLLPAMSISQSANQEPVRRNLMMVAAHLIWGAATGSVADLLERRGNEAHS